MSTASRDAEQIRSSACDKTSSFFLPLHLPHVSLSGRAAVATPPTAKPRTRPSTKTAWPRKPPPELAACTAPSIPAQTPSAIWPQSPQTSPGLSDCQPHPQPPPPRHSTSGPDSPANGNV